MAAARQEKISGVSNEVHPSSFLSCFKHTDDLSCVFQDILSMIPSSIMQHAMLPFSFPVVVVSGSYYLAFVLAALASI